MTKTIKNITSCTHCGDTYSVDDAGFPVHKYGDRQYICSEESLEFLFNKTECFQCKRDYQPSINLRPATMDLWIYDIHKECKGG